MVFDLVYGRVVEDVHKGMRSISEISLDRQFDHIPKDVVYCRNCVVSNQRPRTRFTDSGICSACQWAKEKDHDVDWGARRLELEELCDQHRSKDGSFDVVVPGSGGKDSALVAHQLREIYGMHPLCVTWSPFEYTDIGWRNLQNFIKAGFTNILGQPSLPLHRKLTKLGLILKGDPWEPFTYGQKAWAFHIATRFDVGLIMYGENGELEYGGSEQFKYKASEGPEEWKEGYLKGSSVDELISIGLELGVLTNEEVLPGAVRLYQAPHPNILEKSGVRMYWYSYYHKWVPQENYYYAVNHTGFKPNPAGRSEGTYTKYVSLDDKLDGFHWYLSYMKFGMARASRDAQTDIRRHHLTREEGVALTNRYDGEFPERYFEWFLDFADVTKEQFWEVCDYYRSLSNVWEKKNGKWVMNYPVT